MVQEEFRVSQIKIGTGKTIKKGKILVVDDIEMNLILLEEILSDQNYDVKITSESKEVINLAKSFYPDVILLDLIMPGIDGFSLLKKLKRNPETKDSEVIIVTAKSDTSDIGKTYELGAYDYIKKPYNNVELLIRVNGAIRLKKTLDEQRIIKKQLEFMNKNLMNQKLILEGENLELKMKLEDFSGKLEPQELSTSSESILKPGNIYLCYEPKPNESVNLFVKHLHNRFIGLMISRQFPEEVKKRYFIKNTPIFWITSMRKGFENNAIGPQQIQEIIYLVKNFFKTNKKNTNIKERYRKIIMMDGLELLITYNTFNTFLRFLGSLYDLVKMYESIIILSCHYKAFNVKERALLEREVIVIENPKNIKKLREKKY
ncbi:MAG: response regulator [Promethearchaeota archaeon]